MIGLWNAGGKLLSGDIYGVTNTLKNMDGAIKGFKIGDATKDNIKNMCQIKL